MNTGGHGGELADNEGNSSCVVVYNYSPTVAYISQSFPLAQLKLARFGKGGKVLVEFETCLSVGFCAWQNMVGKGEKGEKEVQLSPSLCASTFRLGTLFVP